MVEMLGPLPARPPTPPRPGSRIDQDEIDTPSKNIAETPQTANSSRAPPSSRASKRVTWSPWLHTTIDLPSGPDTNFRPKDSPFKPKEPNSRDSPYKSILKESNSPIPVWSPKFDLFTSDSFAMLLESVIQQLAGESITSRLDAYMQFFNALRTYDSLPTAKDIAGKLSLITDFIQRDVSRDLINGAPLDINLANQALKLSAALVWHSGVSPMLPEEFKVFLVEHSTTCLQDGKVPKSVLTHYMSILSAQNFGPRVMTNARVIRLLTALEEISNHVSGKAIALHRLTIYQRLLSQSKTTFVSRSSLWTENLVYGLLHPMKDNRSKAISLGFQVASAAGPNQALSKNLRELFDRPLEKDRKLVNEVRERMSRMMASTETGIHVPQIWSIIVLLMRSKGSNLEQWEHFKEWVLVLQKCFNCSEPSIKAQAILGWNRFVFAVSPNEKTSPSLVKMLGKPIFSQFERRKSDKSGPAPTQLALSSYYNLIYYAFRPSLPPTHLDIIWEEYIAVPSASIFSSVSHLSDSEARVLAALLWSPQAKIWTENRINDPNKIEAEELPSIDSKWVRSRVSAILRVFESLFKASVWDDNELEISNIARAWSNLSSALSLASSKEITPSTESMQAVAGVLGLFNRLWNAGLASLNASGDGEGNAFFERFQFLSTTMISSLGSIPFTERLLLKTSDGTFQTSNTPTHRQSNSGTNLNSPILYLLQTISANSVSATPTLAYVRLVEGIIQASCKGRISRGSRLELLQQCADLSTAESTCDSRPSLLSEAVWKASARAAADALQSFPSESARERDGSVSRDYENVNKILVSGLRLHNVFQEWSHLLGSFMRVARTEKGDQGLPALIIEPLAGCLMNLSVHDTYLPSASLLSQSLSIPFLQGNSVGNGHTVAQQPSPPPFPYKLTESIGRTLNMAYDGFSVSESQGLAGFIESLTSFLGSGAPHFRSQLLETLQASLKPWIKDGASKFDFKNGVDSRILTACRALTFAVLNVLQTCVRDDLTSLKRFDVVICAGLESPHASRAKKFVDFWYSTASKADEASSKTSIGASVATALDNLKAIAQFKEHNKNTIVSSSVAQRPTALNHDPQAFLYPNSSPVIGVNEQPSRETSESTEPQLPVNFRSHLNEDSTILPYPGNRRDVFRMIEAIRSSSPANTPGGLGFDTPVHLRRQHGSQSAFAFPLTPTLAPAENEDGFIGSSPTPATRDPTPALHSDAPVLRAQDIAMNDASDLPSSPPEITSRSPSPRKQTRKARRRSSARAKKAKAREAAAAAASADQSAVSSPAVSAMEVRQDTIDVPEQPKENTSVSQVDERPPSRRTRSALSQSTENDQNWTPVPAFGTPAKPIEAPTGQSSKAKSASRKKSSEVIEKTVDGEDSSKDQFEELPDALPTQVVNEYIDSGDDLDVQIASQLSQDLGLAVDQGGQHEARSAEPTTSAAPQSSKKRKRTEDSGTPMTANERRRSTRLSTTKEVAPIDLDDPDATQSQEVDIDSTNQASFPAKPAVPTPRRSTRSSQHKNESVTSESLSPIAIRRATQEQNEHLETPQPPLKRTRKSLRGEDKSNAGVVSPAQSQSSYSTRSGRTRSSQNKIQQGPSLLESTVPDPSSNQPDIIRAEDLAQAINPTPEVDVNLDVPLVSTEEATTSPGTESGPLPVSISQDTDSHMNVDTVVSSDQIPAPTFTHVAAMATTGIQTEPIPTPEPETTEAGITNTLKKLLENMKNANLGLNALREVDDLLFNIRVEAHDASRRHNHIA
ncbi:uncharacterized protein N7484_011499 [Penicillium longicatenatum]|uniref:uncharacterized protein n=1 Tax=Penicillium longicatenatum TaxID=1561947 RepID=UPI0025468361|nr:uncharacterized protein N7484_011499 [Penicillium longicatenatum]KAJ5631399.1 hypothetical protein N7484_011499 [Penicillium longicatenatum]